MIDSISDKDRIDFLDAMNRALNRRYGTAYRWELILSHNINRLMLGHLAIDLNDAAPNGLPSCRDAIDKKMRELRWAPPGPLTPDPSPDGGGG